MRLGDLDRVVLSGFAKGVAHTSIAEETQKHA